jgi:hypothetical protein
MLDNYLTEQQFVDDAKRRGIKTSRRTVRKWRAQRRIPFLKINNVILIPRDWPDQLKLTRPRQASA